MDIFRVKRYLLRTAQSVLAQGGKEALIGGGGFLARAIRDVIAMLKGSHYGDFRYIAESLDSFGGSIVAISIDYDVLIQLRSTLIVNSFRSRSGGAVFPL